MEKETIITIIKNNEDKTIRVKSNQHDTEEDISDMMATLVLLYSRYHKVAKVDACLDLVNEFMDVYTDMARGGFFNAD